MSASLHLVGLIETVELPALASHRAACGWELLAADSSRFWLRVPMDEKEVFAKLPLSGRWSADETGHLTRMGKRVPDQMVPLHGWRPVAMFLPVGPPPRGTIGMPPSAVEFHLEPDDREPPTEGILCRWVDFHAWAQEAFAPRLKALRFARCDDDRAFVIGRPLPPVRGSGVYSAGRLWLPCGWRLPGHVWPELVAELLKLGTSRVALLHPDGGHEELPEENFVAASRTAVRLTEGEPLSIDAP